MKYSLLLDEYLPLLKKANQQFPVLDLACGSGRNGLFLVENNIPTVFADIREAALAAIKDNLLSDELRDKAHLAKNWQVDFEDNDNDSLNKETYTGILVFNYLHRPLMAQIKNAIIPEGFIFYETFTSKQSQYGRPSNPDFLLNSGELLEHFSSWKIHHHFEGIVKCDNSQSNKAIAQIIAEKPKS